MPIYDYSCTPCNLHLQIWCEIDEMYDQKCENCNSPLQKMVSMFAKTPNRWGDSNGYFDRGLGCYVANSMERERIMKEKNLRPVSQEELDDLQHEEKVSHDKHEKDVATFTQKYKETKDFATAAAHTFDPDLTHRNERFEFEKPWKENLKVITKDEEE
tara:strand:+ start:2553 stop:3026 length:474 start_codon:yes stop_codon:yes gene_type:complete